MQRHRPLIPVVAGFAAGIALDQALQPARWGWFLSAPLAALLVWGGTRRGLKVWGNWALALLIVLPVGGLWHAERFRHKPPWHLKNLHLDGTHALRVRARVAQEPARFYREDPFAPAGTPPEARWLVRVTARAVSADDATWRRAEGGITVFVNGGPPALRVGDEVEFLARPRANRPPTNPGQSDMALSYERHGSYATAGVESPAAFRLLDRPHWYASPSVAVGRLRSVVQGEMERRLGPQNGGEYGLVAALLFGRQSELSPAQEDLFKRSGTLHFLAISGLHVAVLCLCAQQVLTLAGVRIGPRTFLTLGLTWLYVLFTGAHVSAVRAGVMLTLLLAAPAFGRQRDSLSALAGAALVILVAWPQQLFVPGFQLTFAAVWAMIVVNTQFAGILWPWQDLLARLRSPEQASPSGELWLRVRSYLALSCVVWLATAPILAYHFGSVCVLTPVLSLLIWPLVLMLLLVCFGLAAGLALGGLGVGVMGWAALAVSGWIETLLGAAAHLPGFGVYIPAPPGWWAALCMAGLAAWALRDRLPFGRRLFLACAVVLGGAYVAGEAAVRAGRPFTLAVMDVGQGQTALLQAPAGQALLLDAGSFQGGAQTAAEVLWHYRVRRVNAIVLSHVNWDHCSFVPFLSRRFAVERVLLPTAGHLHPYALQVRQALRAAVPAVLPVSDGAGVEGGGLRVRVLHPNARFAADPALTENEASLVVLCSFDGLSALLTGDIQSAALHRLSRDFGHGLKADVLVMPHHGHYHEGLEEFVACVAPALAVISGPAEGCDVRTRAILEAAGVPLWITGSEGAIIVTVRGGRACVRGWRTGRTTELEAGGVALDSRGDR